MEGQTNRHGAEDSAEGGRVQGGTDGHRAWNRYGATGGRVHGGTDRHHVWKWDGEDMEGQMDKRMGTVL